MAGTVKNTESDQTLEKIESEQTLKRKNTSDETENGKDLAYFLLAFFV